MQKVCFLSHRGESDDAPENTLQAFQLAMQQHSDGIELDVRLTTDKQVVCVHDATLERVAGVALPVADSTLQQLQEVHPVPLLAEALSVLTPPAIMQIELKGLPELIPFVKSVIDKFPDKQNLLSISSFEAETIAQAAAAFPDFPRVLLIDLQQKFGTFPSAETVIEFLRPLQCGISFRADYAANAEFVRSLQQAGLRVVCWGVSSDELGLQMARLGVEAMTCNHAVALRKKAAELQLQ